MIGGEDETLATEPVTESRPLLEQPLQDVVDSEEQVELRGRHHQENGLVWPVLANERWGDHVLIDHSILGDGATVTEVMFEVSCIGPELGLTILHPLSLRVEYPPFSLHPGNLTVRAAVARGAVSLALQMLDYLLTYLIN